MNGRGEQRRLILESIIKKFVSPAPVLVPI